MRFANHMFRSAAMGVVVLRDASRSEFAEVTRMCGDWFTIVTNASERDFERRVVVILRSVSKSTRPRLKNDVKVGFVGVEEPLEYEITSNQDWSHLTTSLLVRPRFSLVEGKEKLLLLGHLAMCQGQKPPELFVGHPLNEAVATIVVNLAPMLTVGSLATRLDVDVSTLIRWFKHAGSPPPVRFMGLVRIALVAQRLQDRTTTAAEISRQFGFSSPAALQQRLRMLTD